jgi:hypothetical protein
MKKLIALLTATGTIFCILLFSGPASDAAAIGPCTAQGVTATNDLYGTCAVTDPAHASATFSSNGSAVTLKKVESGQVASFWSSNGARGATPGWVCIVVTVNVSGRAGGQQQLEVTANGVTSYQTFPLSNGTQWYCINLGSSAPNYWWSLVTYLGDKPLGKGTVTETLIGDTTR